MEELIKNFGIDWKLLLAQAINFFILFLLLKKFAYKPVINALKSRKQDIEKGIRFTKEAEEKIKNIEQLKEKTIQKAKTEALTIITNAESTAKEKKEHIIQEAHKKVDVVITDAKRMIAQNKAKVGEEILMDAKNLIREGIVKVLGKMPEGKKDEQLISEALQEIKAAKKYFL